MRLSLVVRSINVWFWRIVYERDDWDESLARGVEKEDRLALLLMLSMLCIWITRRILWILMMIGHGLSCFMLRRMEYDADRYETRLTGSESFMQTTSRLIQISLATDIGFQMADSCLRSKNELPEDLTELAVTLCERLPSAQMKSIEDPDRQMHGSGN